ncbi:MAG: O-antigen ligase family protein [Bacteroidota bacterium]
MAKKKNTRQPKPTAKSGINPNTQQKAKATPKVAPKAKSKEGFEPLQYLVHLYLTLMLSIQFTPLLNALDSNITKWWFLTLVNGLFWALMLINRNKEEWKLNTTLLNQWSVYIFSGLLAVATISFAFVINYGEAFLGWIRLLMMFSILLSYIVILDKKPEIIEFVTRLVIALLLVDGIKFLSDYFDKVYGTGESINLARSYYNNKNQVATTHLLKLPFALYVLMTSKRIEWRVLAGLALSSAFMVFGLLITRAAYVALFVSIISFPIAYFITPSKNSTAKGFIKTGIITYLVVLGVGFGLAQIIQLSDTERKTNKLKGSSVAESLAADKLTSGSDMRIHMWKSSFGVIKDHPLGVGVNNWKVVFPEYDRGFFLNGKTAPRRAHNDPIQVTTELGVLGGLLFVA